MSLVARTRTAALGLTLALLLIAVLYQAHEPTYTLAAVVVVSNTGDEVFEKDVAPSPAHLPPDVPSALAGSTTEQYEDDDNVTSPAQRPRNAVSAPVVGCAGAPWIRYVPSAESKRCSDKFQQFLNEEVATVRKHLALRFRRSQQSSHPAYFDALACLGVGEDPQTTIEQRSAHHWERRAIATDTRVAIAVTAAEVRLPDAYAATVTRLPQVHPVDMFHARVKDPTAVDTASHVLVSLSHPVFAPLHGGVTPQRLVRQGRAIAKLLGINDLVQNLTFDDGSRSVGGPLRIVELGAGNGGLLFTMCPPHPRVRCFGVDFAPALIENGRRALKDDHIDLRVGCMAPHVPTGSVNAFISHAVMTYLTADEACRHVGEALRVLRPGARGLFWMLNRKWQGTRYHESFFILPSHTVITNSTTRLATIGTWTQQRGRDSKALPFCTASLSALVDQVEVYIQGPTSMPIYPTKPRAYFGVVLRRSRAPWPASEERPITDGEDPQVARSSSAAGFAAKLDRYRRVLGFAEAVSRVPARRKKR
jgi:SAM-dependent methyltransferase